MFHNKDLWLSLRNNAVYFVIHLFMILVELAFAVLLTSKLRAAKFYKTMVDAKADWLYNLEEWDNLLTPERRKELYKEQKLSGTVIKEKKVGRNDPCPCGSGKKYKYCCGR